MGYFSENLTPLLSFEVIRRFNNLNLGLKFFQFSRERLNNSHSFYTYSFLLRSLCQTGLHDSAKMVYDWMWCDGKLPNSLLLGFLVSSFA